MSVDARLIPNRTILVGESFVLECSITIVAVIQWLHKGASLGKVETTNNTVVIRSASQQHEGVYSCSLHGLIERQIYVTVEGKA